MEPWRGSRRLCAEYYHGVMLLVRFVETLNDVGYRISDSASILVLHGSVYISTGNS